MLSSPARALDVNITKGITHVKTAHDGKVVKIQRIQDQHNVLTGGFAKTSRKCPPFCIQPMQAAPGVITIGELEVLHFLQNKLNKGTGVLIDARTTSWFESATIPGSISIPFSTFNKKSSDLIKVSALAKLGVTTKTDSDETSLIDHMMSLIKDKNVSVSNKWDFSQAKEIIIWCNGIWCGQSHRAIKGILALGYPAEKIYYYRGGMQAWQSLGLTVVKQAK
jgi:rhodanese-related sulfurtransferase